MSSSNKLFSLIVGLLTIWSIDQLNYLLSPEIAFALLIYGFSLLAMGVITIDFLFQHNKRLVKSHVKAYREKLICEFSNKQCEKGFDEDRGEENEDEENEDEENEDEENEAEPERHEPLEGNEDEQKNEDEHEEGNEDEQKNEHEEGEENEGIAPEEEEIDEINLIEESENEESGSKDDKIENSKSKEKVEEIVPDLIDTFNIGEYCNVEGNIGFVSDVLHNCTVCGKSKN